MTDKKEQPFVSVGVPVHNGEKYLPDALDSLLAQGHENFELIISDNASTDRTRDICRSYCAKDKRVRYYRNPRNFGASKNWQRVLELAKGDYFMWAACDDIWSDNYIETLLDCLSSHPTAVLAAGKNLYINDSRSLLHKQPNAAPAPNPDSSLATAKQLLQQHAAGWLHGIYRKEALLTHLPTFLTAPASGDDIVLLLEICLSREVIGSDHAVLYKRQLPTNNSKIISPKTPRDIVRWQCSFAWALIRVILKSPISGVEKLRLFKTFALYLKRRYLSGGVLPWLKTLIRAGCHWTMGVDRP